MISCRPLVPDACSVQIAATVKQPDGGTTTTQSRLIVTKRNNEWLIAEAREGTETASAAESSAPLDELAWMIGEWVDTSDRVDVRISCDWFANKHFLVRSFSVTTDGQMDLQGTEIVGYDPTTKQIRSWVFDSDGSFSEGVWTQQGKSWSESMKGTLADAGPGDSEIARWIATYDVGLTLGSGTLAPVVDRLHALIEQPDDLGRWQANAFAVYQREFSKKVVNDRWDEMLRALVARRGG